MVRYSIAALTMVFALLYASLCCAQDNDLSSTMDRVSEYSAQGKLLKVDSLLRIANSLITPDASEKDVFRYKYYLGHSLMSKWKIPEAETVFEEALDMAYLLGDTSSIIAALSGRATLSTFKGEVYESIQLQETAKDLFTNGDSSAYYGLVANLGIAYNDIQQYDKSLAYYLKAKNYYEKIGGNKNLALIENNIGELYRERFKDFELAQNHYFKAVRLNKSVENLSGLAMNYHNIALNYLNLEKPDSSLKYIHDAIDLRQRSGEGGKVASDYCVLGDIYTATGEFDKAINYYKKTLSISEEFSIAPGFYYANFGIANLYRNQNLFVTAKKYAQKAIDVAFEMNSPSLRAEVYEWLYETNKQEKNFDQAIIYLEKYDLLSDSLESARDQSFLNATKAKYEANMAKAENERLKLKQEANEAAKEIDRLIKIGMTALLLVLIVLALVIFNAYKSKHRAYKDLAILNANLNESRNQIIDQKEELRKLNKLKTNIVSVLGHDLRGPLVNVSGVVELLKDKSISREEFEEIIKLLDEKASSGLKSLDMVLEWSRLEAGDSNPKIEHIRLQKVIDDIISLHKDRIADKSLEIKTDFDQQATLPADPNQFLSIANNLISNAVKFSYDKGLIKIGVKESADRIKFFVRDSGAGFSEDVLNNLGRGERTISTKGSFGEMGTGIGLRIVSDFIDAHGGELIITNHPEGGGLVSVSFPKNGEIAKAV